jgi:hypothetical protein
MHLNPQWLHLLVTLRELSIDASPLLRGDSIFPDIPVKRQKILHSILEDTEDTLLTKDCLEILCFNFEKLISRQLEDQLPGGIYHQPSEEVMKDAESCPTSNRIGERDFSDIDRDVTRAPQKATAHHSSSLTFRNNRTSEYLQQLPVEERARIFHKAMKLAPGRRIKNREKLRSIRKRRQLMMVENKARQQERKRKAAQRCQQVLDQVNKCGGVWESTTSMNDYLAAVPNITQKLAAVKAQLAFHRSNHCPSSCRHLCAYSSNGRAFPYEQLKGNLETLITRQSDKACGEQDQAPTTIKCPEERSILITAFKTSEVNTKTGPKTKSKQMIQKSLKMKRAKKVLAKAKSNTRKPKITPSRSTIVSEFQFQPSMLNSFVAVGYENAWYLGEIIEVISANEARIKYLIQVSSKVFRWPDRDDVKETQACFVISHHLSISPRDSGLRFWQVDDAKKTLPKICQQYSKLVSSMGWK